MRRIVGGRIGCFDPGVLELLAVNYLRYYSYRRVVGPRPTLTCNLRWQVTDFRGGWQWPILRFVAGK